ncbi:placenta-specific gene 8 protein-like [Asterias amurensis]|uniref:placenta-specific gene 8 protein-like n=1 Tax=Asterias amurensis TaxID=7602 RepID=UPI003AB6E05C
MQQQTTTTVTETTIIKDQPSVGESRTVIIRGPQHEHDWSSGLFECTKDKKSCLMSFLCTWCFDCMLAKRLNESFLITCFPGAEVAMRAKLRTSENIKGSICNDCLTCFFCPCCTLAQMSRELDHVDHRI